MPWSNDYHRRVSLLVRLLPAVAEETCFALKGGTAINLFERALPRLSVDIDLTYIPVEPRAVSLAGIEAGLERIAQRIRKIIPGINIQAGRGSDNHLTSLNIRDHNVQVWIEVTPVLRGTVFPPTIRQVHTAVEEHFGFAETWMVSHADLYAGKIVAALDRQHPRDLFDVRELLANEGISDDLRRAFLVYLLSNGRRISELLKPTRKDIQQEFERGFSGMTTEKVSLAALIEAREALIHQITQNMPAEHRRFLVSIKSSGDADWDSVGLTDARELPAIKWRLQNLARLNTVERLTQVEILAAILEVDL